MVNRGDSRFPALRVGVVGVDGPAPACVHEALEAEGLEPTSRTTDVDAVVIVAESAGRLAAEVDAVLAGSAELPVVGVAVRLRQSDVRGALRVGLSGLLELERVPQALGAVVRVACAGLVAVPRRFPTAALGPVLSVRERQILAMVVLGFTNGEIARKLFVAESTVKSHLSSAFVKLGVRSRNEASALILDPGSGLGTGILSITEDEAEAVTGAAVAG